MYMIQHFPGYWTSNLWEIVDDIFSIWSEPCHLLQTPPLCDPCRLVFSSTSELAASDLLFIAMRHHEKLRLPELTRHREDCHHDRLVEEGAYHTSIQRVSHRSPSAWKYYIKALLNEDIQTNLWAYSSRNISETAEGSDLPPRIGRPFAGGKRNSGEASYHSCERHWARSFSRNGILIWDDRARNTMEANNFAGEGINDSRSGEWWMKHNEVSILWQTVNEDEDCRFPGRQG